MTSHPMLELVELYALDALEHGERRLFESHLDSCWICPSELNHALTVTAALVPDSDPPAQVWDRIESVLDQGELDSNVVPLRRPNQRKGPMIALGSLAAALALALAGVLIANSSGLSGEEAIVAAAEAAALEPGVQSVELVSNGVAVATIVLTAEGQGFVLPTSDLPALASDLTYQLWVVNDEERVVSVGVLGSAPRPAVFTWTAGVSGLALTTEGSGGVAVSEGELVAAVSDI